MSLVGALIVDIHYKNPLKDITFRRLLEGPILLEMIHSLYIEFL